MACIKSAAVRQLLVFPLFLLLFTAYAHAQTQGEPEESGNDAQVRVEYVYADRNEVQQIFLERVDEIWKIARVSEIQRVETPVPYGTPVY